MHGKKFFVTGGEHVTSNNMLIAAEFNQQKAEVMEREKDKKSWVWSIMQGARLHSQFLISSRTSWKTMSGG
jgi:hypothetical protein